MCYSAQVVQIVRKLHRELGIRLDYEEAARLFFRRLEDSSINISRGFEANFAEAATDPGLRIESAIQDHRARTAVRLERELFTQKTRLVNAQRSLGLKTTKKLGEEVRIAGRKIDALTEKLTDLRRPGPGAADNRIFPMVHAGVIIRQQGEHLLTPMRYGVNFPGLCLYNARRDNLERFWRAQFGWRHAVMVIDSFYENVQLHTSQRRALGPGEAAQNVVLQFTPRPAQTLYVACLWAPSTDAKAPGLRGFAAITDDPPADIAAAGHDRCVINLKLEQVEAWLTPEKRSTAELQEILSDRAVSLYEHQVLKAA